MAKLPGPKGWAWVSLIQRKIEEGKEAVQEAGTRLATDKSGQRYAGGLEAGCFLAGGGKVWELTFKGNKNKTAGSRPAQ
jgi:hypothetical protein